MTMVPPPAPKIGLTWTTMLAILGGFALFAALGTWASVTRINGAVIASGVVQVLGRPKTVQHLDGGIVEEIAVTDGQSVEKGDVLMRLDPSTLRANLLIYRTRLSEHLARRDRLAAEQADTAIAFAPVPGSLDPETVALNRQGQTEIFEARRALQDGRRAQLREKIAQFHNQIDGVQALIAAKERQLDLLNEELDDMTRLAERGLAAENTLLGIRRTEADMIGQVAEHRAELARIANSIRDTELEILQGQRQVAEEVVTELRDLTNAILELNQQIETTEKALSRIDIRAPVSGRIHEMQVTTVGGVVPPGGMILQIIPVAEDVVFETRIDPIAVDQVYPGQAARLRFTAFNQRTTPEIEGRIIQVSPSSLTDPASGQVFYRVDIKADRPELARLGDLVLVPGMPVEALLQTGDRTVLSYLLKPLLDQVQHAFREE